MPCPNEECRFEGVNPSPGNPSLWILSNWGYVNCCPKCGHKLISTEISIHEPGKPDLDAPIFKAENGGHVSVNPNEGEVT